MNTLTWSLLTTAIAGIGGTGLGGLISIFIRRDSEKAVSLLLSFAAGMMLSVVCFDLIDQALFAEGKPAENLLVTVVGVLLGFAVIALLNYLIGRRDNEKRKQYQNAVSAEIRTGRLVKAGIVMAFAIALHNFPEGMIIGASYAGRDLAVAQTGGLLLAIVIGLHNIPEGMAVAAPLIAGGMRKSRAVMLTAISGSPTVIGALVGYEVGSIGRAWHVISLGFASGAMLYVVFGELLPEAVAMWRSKLPAFAVMTGMLVGLTIVCV